MCSSDLKRITAVEKTLEKLHLDDQEEWMDTLFAKDAECQERVERIKRNLEGMFEPTVPMSLDYEKWRAFWKKEGVK